MFQLLDADTVDWDIRAPHPLQTWTWGAIRQAEGKRVARFFDSQTYEQHQMTLHPIPHTSYMIGYIPKSTLPTDAFISFVRSFAQQNNILFIKFEPHVRQDTHLSLHPALTQSTHPLFTTWNQTLALNSPEKKLLSQMHHKTRYNIRLASKKGVYVHIGTSDQDYAVFEKLYFDTCRRQRYHGHTLNYHRTIWKALTHTASSSHTLQSVIAIAYLENEALAAFQLWRFDDTMYYVYGGSSTAHKSVMAPNLLMWEAIRYAQSVKCSTFDMWGSLPPDHDPTDPWAGFTRFKAGYGTTFVQYVGSLDFPLNSQLYKLYGFAHQIRQKILSWR